MNTNDLQGKIVVITGSGSGVGRRIAYDLGQLGARLVLCDISQEQMEETAKQLEFSSLIEQVLLVKTDISSISDVQHLYQETEKCFGKVDVLINCAGIWDESDIEEISENQLERIFGINLKGTLLMCQGAFSLMRKYGVEGSIVNIASTAGEFGSIRPAAHYAASKGGIIALSKSLAREGAKNNIRVNVVSPGPLDTPMFKISNDEQRRTIGERTLLGRMGRPEDISNGVLYLASSASSWVTGEVLRINGGSLL